MNRPVLLLTVCAAALAAPALAQTAAPASTPAADSAAQEDIVVTAVARGTSRLTTSISTSSLSSEAITEFAPRSAAELFRNLPGIRSESSGGEGNANISVRGLPVSTGGAKWAQLQEDGLGILEFGDITFGNSDIFQRLDFNIARVESVRGGSSSTFVSNAPGGVINIISKTGETDGGAVQATFGLDYEEYRIDADYGMKLSDGWRFHIGGFYRQGEGPRRAGYDGNQGGQVRGNVTKEFSAGFIRLNFKYLDDHAIAYLPSPVFVTGSDRDPRYKGIPGLSPNNDTLHSSNFKRAINLDDDNEPRVTDIRDGMRPIVKSVGFETQWDLGDKFTVTDRFRYSDIHGRFVSPFPSGAGDAQDIANALLPAGTVGDATLRYATGRNAGQLADPATLGGNGLLTQIILFNVELNSLDNIANDLRLSKRFTTGIGEIEVNGGFYASRQTVNTSWRWTAHLLETRGDNAALIDVVAPDGTPLTDGGTVGYGATFFGSCCRRLYNLDYSTQAPFASLTLTAGGLTLDGSLRYDFSQAKGYTRGDGPVQPVDVNGDGVISVAESKTTVLPAARSPVDYDVDYLSYSFGANYLIMPELAAFARHSRGGRVNADRLLFGNSVDANGRLNPGSSPVDHAVQTEAGLKYRQGPATVNLTGFLVGASEQNYDPTQPPGSQFVSRRYRSYGVEAEGVYNIGRFQLAGTATWTESKIRADRLNPGNVGNTPRRQAEFIYQVTPQYRGERFTLGANVVGTTSSYTSDVNQLKLPGYTQVNAFLSVKPIERVTLLVNANNVFDVKGFTEAEEPSIPLNGIVRARSINGRTVSASARFDF